MLNKSDILQAEDIVIEKMNVKEWGGDIYIKSLTGAERDAFEASIVDMDGDKVKVTMKNARARLAARAICDQDGKRLFTDADIPALGKKNGAVLQRIFDVAQRLSGFGKGEVDKLVKNSKSAQAEDSISG